MSAEDKIVIGALFVACKPEERRFRGEPLEPMRLGPDDLIDFMSAFDQSRTIGSMRGRSWPILPDDEVTGYPASFFKPRPTGCGEFIGHFAGRWWYVKRAK